MHDLRRSAAYELWKSGSSKDDCMAVTGHQTETCSTDMRTYLVTRKSRHASTCERASSTRKGDVARFLFLGSALMQSNTEKEGGGPRKRRLARCSLSLIEIPSPCSPY